MLIVPPEAVTPAPGSIVTLPKVAEGALAAIDEPAAVTFMWRPGMFNGEALVAETPPPASCSALGDPPRGVGPLNSIKPPCAMKVVLSASVGPRLSNCSVPSPACVTVVVMPVPSVKPGKVAVAPAPVANVPVHVPLPPSSRVTPSTMVSGVPPKVNLAPLWIERLPDDMVIGMSPVRPVSAPVRMVMTPPPPMLPKVTPPAAPLMFRMPSVSTKSPKTAVESVVAMRLEFAVTTKLVVLMSMALTDDEPMDHQFACAPLLGWMYWKLVPAPISRSIWNWELSPPPCSLKIAANP